MCKVSAVFRSLVSRIVGFGVLITCALLGLAVLLASSSQHMADSFAWITHTHQVLRAAQEPANLVRQVESELRGAVVYDDRARDRDWQPLLERAAQDLDRLVRLTADNPMQNARAKTLQAALLKRSALLATSIAQRRDGAPGAAVAVGTDDEALRLMAQVDNARGALIAAEERLLVERRTQAGERMEWNRRLLIIGVPIVAFLIAFALFMTVRDIRRPSRAVMNAMEAMGGSNSVAPLDERTMHSLEFARIARGYNAMIARLEEAMALQGRSEEALQALNVQLHERSAALEVRNQVIERLGLMAHRMQAARTDDELADVISCFLPQILPGLSGAVYAYNNSRNLLVQIATWGTASDAADRFSPEECWALRLGQSHGLTPAREDVACKHVDGESPYHCEPLLAGGEVIGLLYLGSTVDAEMQFRLRAVAEDISSALVNHRLQRNLREQTIRDPLTGLFNRRYLEESLKMEIARSVRSKAPLTVVMCDLDHFKRFNDEYGHDAGDHVLKAFAAALQAHFRGGDVVCRYGGEEFTIIVPGALPTALGARVEYLRTAINALQLHFGRQALGPVSASFGLAAFHESMPGDGSTLLHAADEALYRAKREGRNCVVIAEQGGMEIQSRSALTSNI
jgi:diguanylate cyclase (GGDEF)-like protein